MLLYLVNDELHYFISVARLTVWVSPAMFHEVIINKAQDISKLVV